MKLIDTNVILRYLLDNIRKQHDQAAAVIKDVAFTLPEVFAEVVYVLSGYYGVDRESVHEALTKLLQDVNIANKDAIIQSLDIYRESSLDFVDCVFIGRNHVLGDDVFSFDKKLNRRLL